MASAQYMPIITLRHFPRSRQFQLKLEALSDSIRQQNAKCIRIDFILHFFSPFIILVQYHLQAGRVRFPAHIFSHLG